MTLLVLKQFSRPKTALPSQASNCMAILVRFSLYQRSSNDDTYGVHPVLGLTTWKSSSAILGAVELIPYGEDTPGCYKLHDTSSKHLREMGYV